MTVPPVGLYSIGVRGLDVPALLDFARESGVGFVHLRGGPRGYDLAHRPAPVLDGWGRAAAEAGVPVTGVTADIDLADLLHPDPSVRHPARGELERLADAAVRLGSGWVRLLAARPPTTPEAWAGRALPAVAVPLLAELHHPAWLTHTALTALRPLLDGGLGLLADTAQLAPALPRAAGEAVLARVFGAVRVLHLSDPGTGLDGSGPRDVAARVLARIRAGHPVETAFEWTGNPRTSAACLARYQHAVTWWTHHATTTPPAGLGCSSPSPQPSGSKPVLTPTPTPPAQAAAPDSAQELSALLEHAYGLGEVRLTRLPAGQNTINYRATQGGETLFVKHYPPGVDLAAEREAIGQSRLAGEHGVPVAVPRFTRGGETIATGGDLAVSVWEWVPGRTVDGGLTPGQQEAAGRALGLIHAAFAGHPAAAAGESRRLAKWRTTDPVAKLTAAVDQLLDLIAERPSPNAFDEEAARPLTERRAALVHLPELIAGLPDGLTTQVLHGDFSVVNIMFEGDVLMGVLDFLPPAPELVAYELGRIAVDPRTVVHDPDWIRGGVRLVRAYQDTNPHHAAADVTGCARVALIQLVTSLYGVKDHYLKPGLLQDDLDAFWLLRHAAATRLLDALPDVERALAEAAGPR
ncbi:phosphotransferase [Streptomyces jumonjinensis]|uniref:phosphotransferase n=1 Tax=Streptomyces jumonjinensis TaxID=1945 RepID=UPI0037A04F6F